MLLCNTCIHANVQSVYDYKSRYYNAIYFVSSQVLYDFFSFYQQICLNLEIFCVCFTSKYTGSSFIMGFCPCQQPRKHTNERNKGLFYTSSNGLVWFKVFLPSHELGKLKIGGPKLIPNKRASFFLLIK